MKNTHTIVWSGGFDSTALLLMKMFFPQYGEENIMWNVVSFTSDYVPCSSSDRIARETIKSMLSNFDESKRFNFIDKALEWEDVSSCGGQQSNAWFKNVTKSIDLGENNKFYFGYIRYDDFYHCKGETLDIFKNNSKDDCKFIAEFPFEWETKNDILKYYVISEKIFNNISWDGDDKEVKLKFKYELQNSLKVIFESISLKYKFLEKDKNQELMISNKDYNFINQSVFEFYGDGKVIC